MNPEVLDSTSTSGTNLLTASEAFNSDSPFTQLRFPDGRLMRVPTVLLLEHLSPVTNDSAASPTLIGDQPLMVPVIEEQLNIGKRTVITGTVRLDKHIGVYEEALDIPLAVRTFDIERVPLNQLVDTAPPVRQEGETTIYPLVEEQLILTKQLILREELRVTRRDTELRDTRTVSLRRESIEVTRS